MEFIGTEVGIKIRSAIKAKLTELGKTVDDELIDYIMVMVANKKEENQMARDLQPFLESDTVKFTAWLHKVLQKLEQVTVIVTDEEYKIASSAFGKVNKKRKSTDSTGKKKAGSKDEPKEKKKKVKHEKHKVSKSSTVPKVQVDKQAKLKIANIVTQQVTSSAKLVKPKKDKVVPVHVDLAEASKNPSVDARQKPLISSSALKKKVTLLEEGTDDFEVQVTKVDTSSTVQQPTNNATENVTKLSAVRAVVPVQRPVMMVSDDDDDDDDFINIKTDVGEEEELLEEENSERAFESPDEQDKRTSTSPNVKSRSVVIDNRIPDTSNAQMSEVKSETVRQAVVAPRSVVATTSALPPNKRVLSRTHQKTAPSPTRSSVIVSSVRSSINMPSRPSILSRVGAVLKRKASALSDGEDDGDAKNGSVASVVKVKPRPKVAAGAQAPKNLLLRAMADAHRSIASAPPREIQEPQSNRSPLFTRKFRDRRHIDQHERIAITLPNAQDPSDISLELDEDDLVMEEIATDEAYVPELVATPSNIPTDVVYSPSPIAKAPAAKSNSDLSKTEFLVTLDGYKGFNKYDGDFESEEKVEDEGITEVTEEEEIIKDSEETCEMVEIKPRRQKIVFTSEEDIKATELESSKTLSVKSLDRCRFWPACRSGDACSFHHPTQTCKSFPNCPFGDRCLYIHPNCKFDATCTRKDCPFTHASPRNLSALPVKPPVLVARPVAVAAVQSTCRFFPNCSNINCRFYHPIPCRYGRLCSKPGCSFIHSDVPPKEKMKWVNMER